jgi:hypothetical protein
MTEPGSHELIATAAARAADRPFYLASAIVDFQELRRMDDLQLAVFLRCPSETLAPLRLCRRPDVDSLQFQREIRQIAQRFGIHTPSLLQLLREVSAIEAMRGPQSDTSTGFLMAARDKPPRGRNDGHDDNDG